MNHSDLTPVDGGRNFPVAAHFDPPPARRIYPLERDPDPAQGSLLYYTGLLRKHKWTLLAAAFIGAALGYLVTLAQTPVYRARVSLEILPLNENFLNMRDVSPTAGTPYSPEVDLQTHAKLLQSESVLAAVIEKLKLGERAPEPSPGMAGAIRAALRLSPPPTLEPAEEQLRMASRNLTVRLHPNTRLVEGFYESSDPRLAADFANALGDVYIEKNLQARWQTTQQTGEWLTRQMQDLKGKLERSDAQLQAYARAHNLQFTSDQRENVAEEKLRQLQQELSRAQNDRIEKQSKFELVSSSPADALPEVVDNQTLREYRVKLADLNREIAELSAVFTPSYPKVRKLQAQAASMRASLEKERGNIVNRIRHEYEAARRRENLLASNYAVQSRLVAEQGGHISRYNLLKRETDTTRQVYESMVQRVREASVASALRASNIRVVDRARPPAVPHSPRGLLNTTLGLLAGVLAGFVLVVMRERADRRVQDPGETVRCLNAVELAVIPTVKPEHANGALAQTDQAFPSISAPRHMPLLSSPSRPSAYAESFRAAVTSILFSGQNGSHPKVLVITSAGPDEGKTTVTCNLAVALAEVNRRVLVIDGDLRKPRLHEIFGVENAAGLSDCLRESGPPRLAPENTPVANLRVLPAGSAGNTHLLYSPRLAQLIEHARQEADVVLIDTPPMLQMADARVLARCADAAILIVRADRTTFDAALLARRRFAEDGTKVLGTILNDWNPAKTGAYAYRDYYESYERYYSKA